jgi:hypothetical protein
VERLKKRVYAIALVLLAFGLALQTAPRAEFGDAKSEEWLESKAPRKVADFFADPGVPYRMDEVTYRELNPFGIVVRIFRHGPDAYDVVMIASNRKESFHDQRVCFSAQGWTLVGDSLAYVESKTRGRVPVTLLDLSASGRGKRYAVLFYRGPGGFYSNPRDLAWSMFKEQLWFWRKPNLESVFYRIIPLRSETTKEELLEFTGALLDAASESSDGYF